MTCINRFEYARAGSRHPVYEMRLIGLTLAFFREISSKVN